MDSADSSRRGPLGDFLAARRASLRPADVGLPTNGRPRRVSGLRREEVARLAGISTDYYIRLEQGRVRTASRSVLNALGRALCLNADQHHYLGQLAHPDDDGRSEEMSFAQQIRPPVARLLTSLVDTPALVFSPCLDILAWNRLASALFGDLDAMEARHRNYARMIFLDPHTRSLVLDWKERAQEVVSSLRMALRLRSVQARTRDLVGELTIHDRDFRTWWGQHLITMRPRGRSRLNHPVAGKFSVDWQILINPDDHGQGIAVLSVPHGTPAHGAIQRLDAWARTQGLRHGVALQGAGAHRGDLSGLP